jgi:hypothetical protein
MKLYPMIMKKCRFALVLLPVFLLTQCFQINQILDWQDDGTMDVRWVFRFSKALEQAQKGQQGEEKKEQSLGDMMEKQKKELPDSLKGLVKNLNFKKIENEYDSGMEISFQVPNYEKFPFKKLQKEDFPLIPAYLPEKKQIVFHFEPMKKPEEQKKDDKKKTNSGSADKNVTNDGGVPSDQQDPNDQMNAMGKQITQLFLSSVRYQIFLGKKFNPDRVTIKKGKEEKKLEIQKIIDLTVIDLPLFAMFGEKEEPFDLVIYLK